MKMKKNFGIFAVLGILLLPLVVLANVVKNYSK